MPERFRLPGLIATIASGFGLASSALAKSPVDYAIDVRDYVTSPTRWDRTDWLIAGGAVATTALAYNQDERVRDHFAPRVTTPSGDRNSLRDDAPLAALTLGTLAVGKLTGDAGLVGTGADMIEAYALGTASSFALKHVFARERPDATNDRDAWRSHGDSFPSGHTTAAFAATQVFAESRPAGEWSWRLVAYSLAAATAYARLEGNMHWLSDTVAGAALGTATGHFVAQRDGEHERRPAAHLAVEPLRTRSVRIPHGGPLRAAGTLIRRHPCVGENNRRNIGRYQAPLYFRAGRMNEERDDESQGIVYLLKCTELAVRGRAETALAQFDLTPTLFLTLFRLQSAEGLSSADLARTVGVRPQSIVEMIRPLERAGLIRRKQAREHRRILRISLTAAGERLLARAIPVARELEKTLVADFTSQEIAQLNKGLTKLLLAATVERQVPDAPVEKPIRKPTTRKTP